MPSAFIFKEKPERAPVTESQADFPPSPSAPLIHVPRFRASRDPSLTSVQQSLEELAALLRDSWTTEMADRRRLHRLFPPCWHAGTDELPSASHEAPGQKRRCLSCFQWAHFATVQETNREGVPFKTLDHEEHKRPSRNQPVPSPPLQE